MSTTAHSHSGEALQTDPSRTATLRKRYAAKLRGRYDDLNAAIRTGIVEQDVFGLRGESLQPAPIDPPPPFRFETDDRKHEEFMSWLHRQLDRGVLRVISRNGNVYIQNAYQSGLRHAERELQKAGHPIQEQDIETTFNLPIHQESVSLLYTRNYEALQGINQEVAKQISRSLSDGFAQGQNPRTIARDLSDRVDSIGRTRATVLARTEVINAHSTSTLNRYDQAGIDEVSGRAEFRTAGDSRVCPICRSLNGNTYTIEEARGVIPVHPQCRCVWLPVVS